ncbi:hypothetical protein [Maridesulfovibrio sp.]|uniref:hypothetical protein n=1 Tax=unclassified Maridesulfovibrio TaxID=2794999 RepID=UPI003B009C9C
MLVGIDLDNTIICYDRALHGIALERGLISADTPATKQIIRDDVRAKHGEMEWQKLQVAIYGPHIDRAELMAGVWDFLLRLKENGIEFKIVSHKTRYPNYGENKVDLRTAAIKFLEGHNFFNESGVGLTEKDVFFLSTRTDKIRTIRELGCSLFIDDLKELYLDTDFPDKTARILLSTEHDLELPGVTVLPDFTRINEFVFAGIANGEF